VPKVSPKALREVQQAPKTYEVEVEATHLSGDSKQIEAFFVPESLSAEDSS
jgi:hypothetical protein